MKTHLPGLTEWGVGNKGKRMEERAFPLGEEGDGLSVPQTGGSQNWQRSQQCLPGIQEPVPYKVSGLTLCEAFCMYGTDTYKLPNSDVTVSEYPEREV